jgi:hypothetical protein
VNVSRIKRFVKPLKGQEVKPPALVIVEGEKEYEVEEVINS